MITMINGIYDAPDSGYYWEFLRNGQSSNSGIDSTILNDGDIISFKNVKYSESLHGGTLLEVKYREANKAKA